MAQNILAYKGSIVPRRTIRQLAVERIRSAIEVKKRNEFDTCIKQMLGDMMSLPPNSSKHEELELENLTEPDTNSEDELPPG